MGSDKALLIVDHGSVRSEANKMLEGVGNLLQKMRPNLIVEIAHMELAEPTIAQGIQKCASSGAHEIIVHPYMLSPGRHSTKDIPEMVQKIAHNYPLIKFTLTDPLGIHENICKVVLERSELD